MNNKRAQITRLASGLLALALALTLIPMRGMPAQATSPGDVVINEIMQDPA